jgi:hypothetical protein
MDIRKVIILILTIVLVTIPLCIFVAKPVSLVHLQVIPNQNYNSARILSTDIHLKQKEPSEIHFDMQAYLQDKAISEVIMSIRPDAEGNWYPQTPFMVDNGYVVGTAQLGSNRWPLKESEEYSYKLYSKDNKILSEGRIIASINHIAGADSLIILGIGLVASILQIGSFLLRDK